VINYRIIIGEIIAQHLIILLKACTKPIISATLQVYNAILEDLRPTPAKCHYTFNFRDISRVILGCLSVKKEAVTGIDQITRLFTHELFRVFGDRLVDQNDEAWLCKKIKTITKTYFGKEYEKCENRTIFGNQDDRLSNEICTTEFFVQKSILKYNTEKDVKLSVVVTQYVLDHLTRITRVLNTYGGNALLVGVGGSGRQSLTRLASFMANIPVFQPEMSENYDGFKWRNDIRKLLRTTGVNGEKTVFLVTDNQLTNEAFFEDITALANGDVVKFFAIDERQEIIKEMRSVMQKKHGRDEEFSTLGSFIYFNCYIENFFERF
jgi:dynein heavy chain